MKIDEDGYFGPTNASFNLLLSFLFYIMMMMDDVLVIGRTTLTVLLRKKAFCHIAFIRISINIDTYV